MTALGRIAVILVASLPLWVGVAAAQDKSLYQRLGGYDAIAAVTDDFLGRLEADPVLNKYFVGLSDNTKMRARQQIVDLICKQTGGPCFYLGRDMKTVHQGMGITKAEWEQSGKLFQETLNKFKVPEREQKDIGALITPLEKDIVEK